MCVCVRERERERERERRGGGGGGEREKEKEVLITSVKVCDVEAKASTNQLTLVVPLNQLTLPSLPNSPPLSSSTSCLSEVFDSMPLMFFKLERRPL